MRANLTLLATGIAISALSSAVTAFERDHDAHEHGHARLMVAIEKNELQLMLQTPSMNLLDFEHKATSKKDQATLKTVTKQLRSGNGLLTINPEASCSLEKAEVESSLLSDGHHDDHDKHHDDHDKHHDDHDKEHASSHKEDHHKDEHGDEHDDKETHSEFEVTYHYECKDISKLSSVTVGFFKAFSGFEEIEANILLKNEQKLVELTAKDNVVRF